MPLDFEFLTRPSDRRTLASIHSTPSKKFTTLPAHELNLQKPSPGKRTASSTFGFHTPPRPSERPSALSDPQKSISATMFMDGGSAKRKSNAFTPTAKKARLGHDPFTETNLTSYATSPLSESTGTPVLSKKRRDHHPVVLSPAPCRKANRRPTSTSHSELDNGNHFAFISEEHVPVSEEGLQNLEVLLKGVNYVRASARVSGDRPGYYIEFKTSVESMQEGIRWSRKMNKPDGDLLLERRVEVQLFRNNGKPVILGS